MKKPFVWQGPSGYNPDFGAVVFDQQVMIPEDRIEDLKEHGLIKEIEKKKTSKKENE